MEEKKDFVPNNRNELFLKACELGFLDVVQFMYDSGGIDINYGDKAGHTALYLAVSQKNAEIADYLLALEGLDLHKSKTFQPIYAAIESGQIELAKKIMSYPGADVNMPFWNSTPLTLAIEQQHPEIVDFLLAKQETDALCKYFDTTSLSVALEKANDTKAAWKILNSRNCEYFRGLPKGLTLALKALELGDEDLFLEILQLPDISIDENLLFQLLEKGETDTLDLVLELPQADINCHSFKYGTLMAAAISLEAFAIADKLLCRSDFNVNKSGAFMPLATAARLGNILWVQKLLQVKDIDINARSWNEPPALLAAVKFPEIARLLLAQPKIDMMCTDLQHNTALHKAVEANCLETVKLLIEHGGIDINAANGDASCLLSLESRDLLLNNKEMAIQFGLQWLNGNFISYENFAKTGVTALEIAIVNNFADIAAYLLKQSGIDFERKNAIKSSALLLAITLKADTIASLILDCANVKVNGNGEYCTMPLLACYKQRNLPIFKKLLDNPHIDVNLTNSLGETLLSEIVTESMPDTAFLELLLQNPKIDINAPIAVMGTAMSVIDYAIRAADSIPQVLLLLDKYFHSEVKSKLSIASWENKQARKLLYMD